MATLFTAPPKKRACIAKIWETYKRLEYLQGDGKAYIKTGINLFDGLSTVVDFKYEDNPQNDFGFICGCWVGNQEQYAISKYYNQNTAGYGRSFNSPSNPNVLDFKLSDRIKYDLNTRYLAYTNLTTGEEKLKEITSNFPTLTKEIYLFGANAYSINLSKAKIFSCHFINRNINDDIYYLVPVYRREDRKPGMLDLKTYKFFTNAAETGEFIIGPSKK